MPLGTNELLQKFLFVSLQNGMDNKTVVPGGAGVLTDR